MKRFAFLMFPFLMGTAFGQVFDRSPTASSGVISEGDGQMLLGGFGLNAKDSPEYLIYRKYGAPGPDIPLQEADNDVGNVSSMTWTGLHHNGTTGIIDPGMFIGTKKSTTSDPGQLLYMKPLVDEGAGGNGDSNLRADWDLRFGFLEDPDAFVNLRDPNDESWDLWSGEWGTDGVSAQLNVGTNDTLDETDWYTRMGAGLRLNAAESFFANEGGRTATEMIRTRAGSGEELDEAMNVNSFAGVGYDDAIEISWNMALNDPDNANETRKREVKLTVKVGNVIHEGVFDPGEAGSPVAPNDDGEDFSDGFFDWQNATPVFFVADIGPTMDGFGSMGIFLPGDVNADGIVDPTDRSVVESFVGQTDTSYSRGDIDQDGDTDVDDVAAWDAIGGGGLVGDFNLNGQLDSPDIDDLAVQSAGKLNPPTYDLNADQLVDDADIKVWIKDLYKSWVGDANLDGEFNSGDLVVVLASGSYEQDVNADWSSGDFNGDGRSNTSDLVFALADGGYEQGPVPAATAVPEPAAAALVGLGCLLLAVRRRRI